MAFVKNGKKNAVKETKKDEAAKTTKKDEKVKTKSKAAEKEAEVEIEEEEVAAPEVVVENTNPDDFTYLVKLDNRKFSGRSAEQVDALVFGALGSAKKISIEKE